MHDSPARFLQHSLHDSPAPSLQHSKHDRAFTWSAAPCNNCTPQAAGADFGVTDSSTGNVETWSDLKSSITGVGDRTDQVETLLGLARRQDESDPASLPDLIASLVEVNELVAPLLQASINQTRDSGAAVVSAIRAANVATVAGLSPPEVSVEGGEMISVGGRGFIPGLDGLCEPLSPSPPFPSRRPSPHAVCRVVHLVARHVALPRDRCFGPVSMHVGVRSISQTSASGPTPAAPARSR